MPLITDFFTPSTKTVTTSKPVTTPEPVSTIMEFMMILTWACLSETPYYSKNLLFAMFFTSLQVMAEIAGEASLEFVPGLLDVVQSVVPPTIEFFKSLPTAELSQWGVYAIVLKKPGCSPKLYIGSGTSTSGVHARLNQYSQRCLSMFPSGVQAAFEDGYAITHRGLLCRIAMPTPACAPLNRLLFIALEATFGFLFWAMRPQKEYPGMDKVRLWDPAILEYEGICTHSSLTEQVRGDFNLTAEELEAHAAERKKRFLELKAINNSNWHYRQMATNYDAYITAANERVYRSRANNPGRNTANAAKHRAIAFREKKYYCKDCELPYSSSHALLDHYKTSKHKRKLVDSDNPFFCRPCNKGLNNKSNHTRHNEGDRHIKIVAALLAAQEDDPQSVPYDLGEYTKTAQHRPRTINVNAAYFCRFCNRGYDNSSNFNRHKKNARHLKAVAAAAAARADAVGI
ncbi:hypothetical protein H9Q70_006458 [Fusarium xylarioides]|nr:hypothetical protein H9Q70_006458 [Fusarium xylarioides]KAG5780129.1 hypothetical protein H9Q73_006221 [Fusarium xylarioides]